MDFDHWWKYFGQFMPPCDQFTDSRTLEQFKGFAALVWAVCEEGMQVDVNEAFEQGKEEGREEQASQNSGAKAVAITSIAPGAA